MFDIFLFVKAFVFFSVLGVCFGIPFYLASKGDDIDRWCSRRLHIKEQRKLDKEKRKADKRKLN